MPTIYAAVGDSITYGQNTSDPATKAYPALTGIQGVGYPGRAISMVSWLAGTEPMIGHLPDAVNGFTTKPNVVIFEMGVNDLNMGASPKRVISAMQTIRWEAKDLGVKMVFATIIPPGKTDPDLTRSKRRRDRVNQWIRRQANYVDFHKALRSPSGVMKGGYDSGDGLHPSDAGQAQLAATLTAWINKQS